MRVGIVSDTHNHLPNVGRIVELFNAARVEHVVHTGDITQPKTLAALSALDAPLCGVFGNNDLERPGLAEACRTFGQRFVDPPLFADWGGRRLVVVHDPLDLSESLLAECEVALHGHDHRRSVARRERALVVNPGECAGHIEGLNSVAVLDLASLDVEILEF